MVNSRPLCYVYDDSIEEIITPSHLLLGRRLLTKFNNELNKNNISFDALSRPVDYLTTLIDHYWNRWNRNICPSCLNIMNLQILLKIVKPN